MKMNRTLGLLLVLCMLLGMIPAGISAAAASAPVSIAMENEWEVLKIVNQERIKAGKQALSMTTSMQSACDTRASELPSSYSHTRPNGSSCFTVLDEKSITYNTAGENIVAGHRTPAAVMTGWMNSEGHRDNITTSNFQHIGVGHDYSNATGNYWVQLFVGSTGNTFSDLTLYGGQSTNITLSAGQTLSDLNLALQCTSGVYGTCYLPLIDELCSGFSSTTIGTQTVTVNYQGLTLTLQVTNSADRFTDVSATDWYYGAVGFVADNSLFAGVGDNKFAPQANMSRAMFVQVLFNLTQKMEMPSASESYTYTFKDVEAGKWYTKAVAWAAGTGLVSGYDADTFGTNDNITREQMAAMIIQFADYAGLDLGTDGNTSFSDSGSVSNWAVNFVSRTTAANIMSGSYGAFNPLDNATRAEVAAVFKNMVEQYVNS